MARLTPPEQNDLLNKVGQEILSVVSEDWESIHLTYSEIGGFGVAKAFSVGSMGGEKEVRIPSAGFLHLGKLRKGMYRQGEGTWFTINYTVKHPGRYEVDFDYTGEPSLFRRRPESFEYKREVQRYPRDAENVPDWLERALMESGED